MCFKYSLEKTSISDRVNEQIDQSTKEKVRLVTLTNDFRLYEQIEKELEQSNKKKLFNGKCVSNETTFEGRFVLFKRTFEINRSI